MKIEQKMWSHQKGWSPNKPGELNSKADLVFLFGATALLKDQKTYHELKLAYPKAHILGCSTAGEIYGTQVTDEAMIVTAIHFDYAAVKSAKIQMKEGESSFQAGQRIMKMLDQKDLAHVFLLSDGVHVNGSELVKGLTSVMPTNISVTGGLSGDGDRFKETFVLSDDIGRVDTVAVVGLYGNRLKVNYCSAGGWEPFGPQRLVTRSKANVLFELDNQSALALYKEYLGEYARKLPASAQSFPLSLKTKHDEWVIRTVLAVNEKEQSLTFAGDVPEGAYVRLMTANSEGLIQGARQAAQGSVVAGGRAPELAILTTCVGRKMVLGQRVEEEVEIVREVFGEKTVIAGFYSYGEISPFAVHGSCELHNQTMAITTMVEV